MLGGSVYSDRCTYWVGPLFKVEWSTVIWVSHCLMLSGL